MIVKDIINIIEELAPLPYAEDFDNVGLLVGDNNLQVTGVLVTLDTLENVIDEAIEKDCNLIVSFHPIIFSGLKKLTGSNYVERVVMKAIKHNIAIYAMHTALDNCFQGVNAKICEVLGLKPIKVLLPQKETIKKLITFVPTEQADAVREALFNVGAGGIGNYNNCSFNIEGIGTFKGNENSNPTLGKPGELQKENEIQIGVTYAKHLESIVLKTLFQTHPYEEVAYEITTLENLNQHIGMGMMGEFPTALSEKDFLKKLQTSMNAKGIRHTQLLGKPIKKVAVLGGSGAFAIKHAIRAGVDAYVTADVKYHEFYQAENRLLIADIGHYETEQFTKNLLVEHLTKKIHNFAALSADRIILSQSNTNPVKYF